MNKEMKSEAIKRMKEMGLFDGAIGDFEREDVVCISKNGGFIYGLSEEEKELKNNFEKETGNLIYHMIHSKMAGFDMVSALIVSKYKEDWPMEQYDKNNGYVFTYTFNLDEPQFSEFGTIGVECRYGGLVRIF